MMLLCCFNYILAICCNNTAALLNPAKTKNVSIKNKLTNIEIYLCFICQPAISLTLTRKIDLVLFIMKTIMQY